MSLSVERLSSGANRGRDPIVLLHGWGFDSRAMAPLAWALQPLADVWLVDLPSFGGSASLPAWRCEQVLEQLAASLPKRCQLVGWSLGGMLATQFAHAYPARVSRLVTLASNACFVAQRDWPDAMTSAVNRQFNTAFTAQPLATARRFAALVAAGSSAERERLKQLRLWLSNPLESDESVNNWRAALDYLAASDNRAALAQLACPALHLLGERDALLPVGVAPALTALNAGHKVTVIADASHAMHLDQPHAVAQAITDFLTADLIGAAQRDKQQLNKQQVARSFSRAATTYESAARLQRAVGEQLLSSIAGPASRVLDLGSGTGLFGAGLRRVTGAENHWALDLAEGMLRYGREHHPEPDAWLCADAEALPLASESIDLVFSSLAIQWCENLTALFSELYRVLAPGGCIYIATLGPGTLNELQSAWRAVDEYVHVNHFMPPELLLAAAQAAGFVDASLRVHTETLFSANVRELTRELKGLGAHNVNRGRPQGLTGRKQLQLLEAAYEQCREARGLPASYEVVYLSARKPEGV
ncbi:malonyl-ACP O-methyltransferase BioC [Gilvimarinus polysaccharolyticus]|uniref:malonyl-ACP O-methyltransferase BioC n=1 Tax=Gilvimarinus polysaccharolyticus TaxID=863921 RepID=UPI000A006FDC|nr:malonyl-ACP O-methyltransferase BioC [Gilvimarinus polysaccharolyticus]